MRDALLPLVFPARCTLLSAAALVSNSSDSGTPHREGGMIVVSQQNIWILAVVSLCHR